MTMKKEKIQQLQEVENREWLESFDHILKHEGPGRAREILELQIERIRREGVEPDSLWNEPYLNTIPASEEEEYPGNREIERRIKSLVRWNAMAMVVQANRRKEGIGGHISTYASSATLFEVGFNHFLRGGDQGNLADLVYFQGHASPGIYARSFLEGRLDEQQLNNFRRETAPGGGLSSYPHPRLMSGYWQFPTVSMGLSPIMAIYQARYLKYLIHRGRLDPNDQKVWAFLGDGEMDEPESMGALTLASREDLDNLIFVINCNLQRLDGPVRGNGSVVSELARAYRGAGWHVIKVLWGENWDPLLEKDSTGLLKKRLGELVDGQRQKYSASDGAYIRKDFFGKYDELLTLVEELSDEDIVNLRRGGHDPVKVYNAYLSAMRHEGSPTVILAQTIKGYGLGEAGEGRNITHQQKKLNEDELKHFRQRFDVPISEDKVAEAPFYRPDKDSEEIKYLLERREKLGGFLPSRNEENPPFEMPEASLFDEFLEGSGKREVATTMAAVRMISKLLKDKNIGNMVVPIVPDESRTFGMEALFKQAGIYATRGQLYEPVDRESLLYYKEEKGGAILEEGISEAGCMSSFIAAGTSYASLGIHSIPFFTFYSMFGFQRIGDLIWAAADMRSRGFMLGGTAGRTTLAGEGLQHQDGNSHLLALPVPCLRAYDPAYAYEMAIIVQEGIRRMYQDGADEIYYITMMNEKYPMPPLPERKGIKSDVLKGIYRLKAVRNNKHHVHLLGSGSILNEVIEAAEILKKDFSIHADIWSVTSYKQLYDDAISVDRQRRYRSGKKQKNHIEACMGDQGGIFIAATDYVRALPLSVASWFPGSFTALGTDGFGLSEDRAHLREYFEVNARHIAWSALVRLNEAGKIEDQALKKGKEKLGIGERKKASFDC